jgi:hypothetical protein
MLMRLWVRGGRIITLTGRDGMPEGDPGGLAIALSHPSLRQNVVRTYLRIDVDREVKICLQRSGSTVQHKLTSSLCRKIDGTLPEQISDRHLWLDFLRLACASDRRLQVAEYRNVCRWRDSNRNSREVAVDEDEYSY